jgi:hypothetical protein
MTRTVLLFLLTVCGVVGSPGPSPAQQPAGRPSLGDLAQLLPASTLAYVELKHPPLVRELRTLFKGSGLDDYAAFRDEHGKDAAQYEGLGPFKTFGAMLAFVFTPEFLDELERFNQHGLALLGFTKDGSPPGVWIMDAGDSNVPNLIVRDVLTLSPDFRVAARVEGVRIYRPRPSPEPDGPVPVPAEADKRKDGKIEKAPPPPEGPAIALLPKVVLLGTDVESVREVILRLKKKAEGPSLAAEKEFRHGAELRGKPGMFGYAQLDRLFGPKGALVQEGKAPWAFDSFFSADAIFLQTAMLLNPQALQTGVAYLGVDRGTVELRVDVRMKPDVPSPLNVLQGDRLADRDLLGFVPRNAVAAVTFPLTDQAVPWEKVLKQLDEITRANRLEELLLGKRIREAFKGLDLDVGKEVLGKVIHVTVGLLDDSAMIVIAEALDAAGAKEIEALAKKLVKKADGEGKPWVVRRERRIIMVAPSDKVVTSALAGYHKIDGFAARPEVSATLDTMGGDRLAGCWSVQAILHSSFAGERRRAERLLENGAKLGKKEQARLEGYKAWLKKTEGLLDRELEGLPAGEVSVKAAAGRLTFRLRQTGLQRVAPRLVDTYLLWELKRPDVPRGDTYYLRPTPWVAAPKEIKEGK